MKKKVLERCLMGAPLGILIGMGCTLFISWMIGDGAYHAVVPELTVQCGTEFNAVLVQTLWTLLYGAVWGGASVIWEVEQWSILRQTVTHLILVCASTFPVAYLLHWMPHSAAGMASYFGIFLGIYLCIWLIQYAAIRRRIAQFNKKMRESGGEPPQTNRAQREC